ncbi:MAG: hypothetical protein ACHQHO_09180 [Solirubrobacterales bacterium]
MTRLLNAWGALGRDQRVAALTSLGLFVSMLLPWYSKTSTVVVKGAASSTEQSLSAFQAFSFVEAAVLLVSVGVLSMLFARAEQRDFQLPGGDGTVVMVAGAWAAILVFYRLFDKPGLQGNERIVSTVGVQWGIFVALLLALGLAYVGRRVRASEHGAPPLSRSSRRDHDADARRASERPDERTTVITSPEQAADAGDEGVPPARPAPGRAVPARAPGGEAAPTAPTAPSTPAGERRSRRDRPRYPPGPSEQMSFEDPTPEDE